MDYKPKVFTKDNPCSKVDLHNCFYRQGKYVPRKVIEARTEIGLNAPKYLLREGYAEERLIAGADYLVLTTDGVAWLSKKLLRYLQLHPEKALECNQIPAGYLGTMTRGRVIRRPVAAVEAPSRVIRRARG